LLAGGVAHDFGSLLGIIELSASLLNSHLIDKREVDRKETTDLGEQILTTVRRGSGLTQQLLNFGARAPVDTELSTIDVGGTVQDAGSLMLRLLGEAIELELKLRCQEARILGDETLLLQVVLNLLVNARDAMPRGGRVCIDVDCVDVANGEQLHSLAARPGAFVRLTVSDNGVGMSPEVADHAFDAFFSTKPIGEGSGLGLAVVYGIVQKLNGWIEVASRPNEGATFKLYFPRVDASARPEPLVRRARPRLDNAGVLVVDDESQLRRLVASVLAASDFRVFEASDGPSALAEFNAHESEIHLLITDLVMPGGLNGYELAESIQKRKPDIEVVFMTAHYSKISNRGDAFASRTLRKPFSPAQLLELVAGRRDC